MNQNHLNASDLLREFTAASFRDPEKAAEMGDYDTEPLVAFSAT
jgi:hypothetical protein